MNVILSWWSSSVSYNLHAHRPFRPTLSQREQALDIKNNNINIQWKLIMLCHQQWLARDVGNSYRLPLLDFFGYGRAWTMFWCCIHPSSGCSGKRKVEALVPFLLMKLTRSSRPDTFFTCKHTNKMQNRSDHSEYQNFC